MPSILAGRYEYQRNLGSGSFGVVRLYRDTLSADHAPVAIKSIPYSKIIQEGHRLIREIEIMLFLRDAHPHVINCFFAFATLDSRGMEHVSSDEIQRLTEHEQSIKSVDCLKKWLEEIQIVKDRIDAVIRNKQQLRVDHTSTTAPSFTIHLVLPFMNGDVDRFIQNFRKGLLFGPSGRGLADGDFWAITVAVIAFQMLFGLDFLHKSKIVHRDLKPENILLRLDTNNAYCSSALIADFGLACLESDAGTFYVCTRTYRPPELIVARQTAHSSIDVWSLGCILYELITWERLVDIGSSRDQNTGEWSGSQAATQLEVVMDVVGTPNPEDTQRFITDEADPVRSYLLKTNPRPSRIRELLSKKFCLPGCTPEIRDLWVDLIQSCLHFFPEQRPTAEDLCKHPLFATYGMIYGDNVKQYPASDYVAVAKISNRPETNVTTALGLISDFLSREVSDSLNSPSLQPTVGSGPEDVTNVTLDAKRVVAFPFLRTEDVLDKYTSMPLQTQDDVYDASDSCEFDINEVRVRLEANPDDPQLKIRLEDLRNLLNYLSQVTQWEEPAEEDDEY